LNTKNKNYKDINSNNGVNYMSLTFGDNQYYSLDIDRDRLLIPIKVPSVIEYLYPQATGNYILKKFLQLHIKSYIRKYDIYFR